MTKVFRVLAFIIAGLVAVQAALIGWAVIGLRAWVIDGNSLTQASMEGEELPFAEAAGFMVHAIGGTTLIPLLGLILLVVGLIAKFPGSTTLGAIVFALIVIQVVLGIATHSITVAGALHGFNALLLFGAAIMAGMRARDVPVVADDGRPLVNA
jgi:hypothetical protein